MILNIQIKYIYYKKMLNEYSEEQQIIFNKYIEGENIFITGPGGTGKSYLIKEIYKDALNKNKNIQVCALTGCAALLLQCRAKTIHSWAGIGKMSDEIDYIINKICSNKYRSANWKKVDILIIDEVSMMSLKLFNLLNELGKGCRNNKNKSFGGIQVIFSGDFFQLPPVNKDEIDIENSKFCFESNEWSNVFKQDCQIELKKIYRQSNEQYIKILNQIRVGKLKRSSYELLLNYVGRNVSEDIDIVPTKLFPTRNKVDNINNIEMKKLKTEEKEYKMRKHTDIINSSIDFLNSKNINTKNIKNVNRYSLEDIHREQEYLIKNVQGDKVLNLKIGAQVMCIVNIETSSGYTLSNGSQGIIVRYDKDELPVVKFHGISDEITMKYYLWQSETIENIGISQLPLILAWALTIHKSQGMSLDTAEIDIGNGIFECGQTYVALSRVKSLDGLYLSAFNYQKILINKKVKDFYEKINM